MKILMTSRQYIYLGVRIILSFFTCFWSFSIVSGQSNFKYRKADRKIIAEFTNRKQLVSNIASFKDITSFLPPNYSRLGNVDYTVFLQKAVNEVDKLIMPNFPVLINFAGIKLRSNTEIFFQPQSKLIIRANNKESYYGLYVEDAQNIRIHYPKIEGDKYEHLGTTGQWGMGISLRNSTNIKIYQPYITKCWGDGIYIGEKNNLPCKNIEIVGGVLDDNRRNGISVISGENIIIKNIFISNTSGVSPGYGIDLEPNTNYNTLENVYISGVFTFNNESGGILFALDNLNGKNKKNIDIKILKHKDYYSPNGMEFAIDRSYVKQEGNNIFGKIQIADCNYKFNKMAIKNNYSKVNKIDYIFKNVYVNNKRILDVDSINQNIRKGVKFSIK